MHWDFYRCIVSKVGICFKKEGPRGLLLFGFAVQRDLKPRLKKSCGLFFAAGERRRARARREAQASRSLSGKSLRSHQAQRDLRGSLCVSSAIERDLLRNRKQTIEIAKFEPLTSSGLKRGKYAIGQLMVVSIRSC